MVTGVLMVGAAVANSAGNAREARDVSRAGIERRAHDCARAVRGQRDGVPEVPVHHAARLRQGALLHADQPDCSVAELEAELLRFEPLAQVGSVDANRLRAPADVIPHRPPFLLLTEVTELDPSGTVKGYWKLTGEVSVMP